MLRIGSCIAMAQNNIRWNDAGAEGAIRLTGGGGSDDPAAGLGVFEIFHAGAWGTVCKETGIVREQRLKVSLL